MRIFEEARAYIKEGRYYKISPTMMDVGSNNVALVTKKGRSVLTCSCSNSARFANDNLCSHRVAFLILLFNEKLYSELDKAIIQVEKYKELNLSMNNLLCLDLLEKIKKSQ